MSKLRTFRALYRLLRFWGNGCAGAIVKAVCCQLGHPVRIRPRR